MTWPNFLIIGAAKAGTTSLYHYLQQHPAVYRSLHKEPNFFAFDGETTAGRGPGFCKMLRKRYTVETYRALFTGATTETAIGEASTKYLYRLHSVERIYHYRPDMKLIAVLRHPVDRGYSQYRQNLMKGQEIAHSFEAAVAIEPQRLAADGQDKYHYLDRGYYGRQLQAYFKRFDPAQMRIYLYEDLVANPARLLADIAEFLEIDSAFPFDTATRHNSTGKARVPKYYPVFRLWRWLKETRRGKVKYRQLNRLRKRLINYTMKALNHSTWMPPLRPELRRQLSERYRDDIALLSELIHRDLSHWLP